MINNKVKAGDIVYLYKEEHVLYTVTKVCDINGKPYCWLSKDPNGRYQKRYHAKFVHPAKDEKKIAQYRYLYSDAYKKDLQKEVDWLKDRQNQLGTLKFRCYETDLFKQQIELLKNAGYYLYTLKSWDEGDGYNICKNGFVNRFGYWITDMDLTPYMNEGTWIGIDELEKARIDDIPYTEIKGFLDQGRQAYLKERGLVV